MPRYAYLQNWGMGSLSPPEGKGKNKVRKTPYLSDAFPLIALLLHTGERPHWAQSGLRERHT